MSTPEDRLLEMMAQMQDEDPGAVPIEMGLPGAPEAGSPFGPIGHPPGVGEGLAPGLGEEEALEMRADIAATTPPGDVEALLAATGSPAAGAGPMIPERRPNPFAPLPGEESSRKNPFAPEGPEPKQADFPTDFPMERGTSRASLQLPELGSQVGMTHFFESGEEGEEPLPDWAQLGLTAAVMTMTDPTEIAEFFTQEIEYEDPNTGELATRQMFPHIGLQQAPDGTLVLTNTNSGQQAIINRPGISTFDFMQLGTIGAMYTPAGRVSAAVAAPARSMAAKAATETARRLAIRQARRAGAKSLMAGSFATETAIQGGQAAVGAEFNKGDIAMATAFGVVPDYVFDPLARLATKIPSYIKTKAVDVVPENIQQALRYAKETGRRIMTQDVVAERMTPAMQIFTKVVERIPITGTGRWRKRMGRERIDALTELAAKYGIDIETDYGTRVMESFVERMMKRRFWGANEQMAHANNTRARQMINNAFEKEMDEISHGVLKDAIRQNRIDDIVVDRVMDSGRPKMLTELWNKLLPEGREAARRRFILRGLEDATWTPGAPGIADPVKFLKWLDRPNSRKIISQWFSPEDQNVLNGAREYLRLTAQADQAGKGAGMVAAVSAGTGGVAFMAGFFNALIGGAAVMSGAGRMYQSTLRGFFLKLAHVKGDEAATAAIMREMTPYMIATEEIWKQDRYYFPNVNITQESLKEGGEDLLEDVTGAAEDAIGDVGQLPDKLLKLLKDE